jgi:protein-S-isoprenylcysteine O-methyltransferase Ste14
LPGSGKTIDGSCGKIASNIASATSEHKDDAAKVQNPGGTLSISLLWQILFYGWTASEIFIAIATRTRRGGGKRLDRGSMAILWIAIVTSISAAEWIGGATPHNMFGGAHWLRVASIAVLVAGLTIRWIAIVSLGKAFSANVAIRPTQSIYQSGLYRFVRHPSYSGLLLVFVAIALHERNWLAAAVVLIPTTAALLYRIHVEEAALHQAFGAQYEAYSKRTKRLIPAIY